MQQKRLILAVILSSAILFIWSYLYPVKPPQNNQALPSASSSSSPNQSATNAAVTPSQNGTPTPMAAQNSAPERIVTIKTPLYEAKFDTRGAEPISWIIKKNKNGG